MEEGGREGRGRMRVEGGKVSLNNVYGEKGRSLV